MTHKPHPRHAAHVTPRVPFATVFTPSKAVGRLNPQMARILKKTHGEEQLRRSHETTIYYHSCDAIIVHRLRA